MPMYRRRSETIEAIQLTATNTAEAAAYCEGTVTADGKLLFDLFGDMVVVPVGYYVPKRLYGGPMPPEEFESSWISNDGGSLAVAFGASGVQGTIAAGDIKDVPVSLSRQMPSDKYQAAPAITSGSATLLGTVLAQGIVARTPTTATVRIKNTGLVAIASPAITVSVIAVQSAE